MLNSSPLGPPLSVSDIATGRSEPETDLFLQFEMLDLPQSRAMAYALVGSDAEEQS